MTEVQKVQDLIEVLGDGQDRFRFLQQGIHYVIVSRWEDKVALTHIDRVDNFYREITTQGALVHEFIPRYPASESPWIKIYKLD